MATDREVLDFIDTIYEQIGTDELWPSLLDEYRKVTNSDYACITVMQTQVGSGQTPYRAPVVAMTVGMDPFYEKLYNEHYAKQDPWLTRVHAVMPVGQVVPSHSVCPDEVLVRTETYNDFLRRVHLHYGAIMQVLEDGARTAGIGVCRSKSAGPYQSEAIAIQRFAPHLQRAVRLHCELETARSRGSAILGFLENVSSAVFVVNSRGQIFATNYRAEQILRAHDGIASNRSVLTAFLAAESENLKRQIAVAASDEILESSSGGVGTITRPSGRASYRIFVSPCPRIGAFPFTQRAAVVFVSDSHVGSPSELEALTTSFHLSRAEARLVAELASGSNLEQAAASLGITRNTAKTQLKNVYGKTSVRSQAGLIKLLYTMPRRLL